MHKRTCKLLAAVFLFALLFSNANGVYAQCSKSVELPDAPPVAGEIRFAVIGDTGRGCGRNGTKSKQCLIAAKLLDIQKRTDFKMLIFLGDNVYDKGHPNDFEDNLYTPYKDLFARGVIFRGVIGNHDAQNDAGALLQLKFLTAADLPAQAVFFNQPIKEQLKFPDTITQTYGSFTAAPGLVKFFALDSPLLTGDFKDKMEKYPVGAIRERTNKSLPDEERERLAEKQRAWLRDQLAASKKVKWRIVLMHHIFYSSSNGHGVLNPNKNAD
ncbi:MAG TPA: metallophosphoesterase, partial [Pyrinomonadaceae bacterium]